MIYCTHRIRDPEPDERMRLGAWLRAAFAKAKSCGQLAVYVTPDGAKCQECAARWIDALVSDKTMGGMLMRAQCERDGRPVPTKAELRARLLKPIM
jgi:hypothetical protein